MRVVDLTAYHVRIPLKKPIRHASFRRTESDNLVVICRLENGVQGYGEGVPRDYVTGETIDSAMELLGRSELANQLKTECRDFGDAVRLAERLTLAPVPGDTRQCQGNAAHCALELAVLDAYGHHFGQPLTAVTRLLAEDVWQPRDRVQYSGAITSARGWKARASAWAMRLYGFRHLKVKVGIAGQNDVERLTIIRRRVGRRMDIRIDANEAWAPAEAAERIRELEPFSISSVEQPIAHEQVGSL